MQDVPQSLHELKVLPVRRKGQWRGPLAPWVGRGVNFLYACEILIPATVALLAYLNVPIGYLVAVAALNLIRPAYLGALFMYRYWTAIDGRIYAPVTANLEDEAKLRKLLPHEGLHDWQSRTNGQGRHVRGMMSPIPTYRRHNEAMAYALDVLLEHKTLGEAAHQLSRFAYFCFWTRSQAQDLISKYMLKLRADCETFSSEDSLSAWHEEFYRDV